MKYAFLLSCAVCVTATLRCAEIAEPPAPPDISENGKYLCRQSVDMLKTLHVAHECRFLAREVSADRNRNDSLALDITTWNPAAANAVIRRGLARMRLSTHRRSLFSRARNALAQSTAARADTLVLQWDSAGTDTIFAVGESLSTSVRGVDGAVIDSPWTTAVDSLLLRGDTAQGATTRDTLRIIRTRNVTRGDTLIADRQTWVPADSLWRLHQRVQTKSVDSVTVYRHAALLSVQGVVYDSITATASSGRRSRWYMERRDNSRSWWGRLDSTRLLLYADSLATDSGAMMHTVSDTSGQVVAFAVDSFFAFSVQAVFVRSDDHTADTALVNQRYNPRADSVEVTAWRRIVVIDQGGSEKDSVEYRLAALSDSSRICSLYVTVTAHNPGIDDTTFLGIRKRSEYAFRLARDGWNDVTILSMRKEDMIRDSRIDRIEWRLTPRDNTPFGPIGAGDIAESRIRAVYAFADRNTSFLEWRDTRDGRDTTRSRGWAGIYPADTVRATLSRSEGSWRYSFPWPFGYVQRGSMADGDTAIAIQDTMGDSSAIYRYVTAEVDSLGYGRVQVRGSDTFALVISPDSIVVTRPGESGFEIPSRCVWRRSDDRYTISFTDTVLDADAEYEIDMGFDGVIEGTARYRDREDSDGMLYRINQILVKPTRRGSAIMGGIVGGEHNESIVLYLKINLWLASWTGTSEIEGTHYSFY